MSEMQLIIHGELIEMRDENMKEMKLLRIDFMNTFKDIVIIKKHINGIRDVLRIMLKKRPDQTTKARLKQIIDILKEEET